MVDSLFRISFAMFLRELKCPKRLVKTVNIHLFQMEVYTRDYSFGITALSLLWVINSKEAVSTFFES